MSTTSATTSSFEPYSIPLDPYNDASDQSTSTIQQQQQRIVSVVTSAEVTNDSIFGLPVVRDWNAEYQGTLERMKSAASDQLACMVQLRDLAEDFVETAERYGRIIVSERHVSNELKTVKPAALGGVAGGEKFVVHGILFKFALDQRIPASSSSALPQWMYGGSAPNDENAMRAAGHELKGVIAMSKCHVDDLCLPLMCLIDYLGFRLVAMSSLPISRRSIVYGSCDGASIHADDDDVNAMIATVARKLNLAPHLVADRTLHVAGDIEAHRGADGRAYVIDLARLMPPEAPDDATNDPRAVFHRLLRAEHVRSADAPLSSDAFTNFQRYDRRAPELNAAVRRETVRLFEQVVPRVAAALCQHVRRGSSLPPNAPRHPRRALTTNSGTARARHRQLGSIAAIVAVATLGRIAAWRLVHHVADA